MISKHASPTHDDSPHEPSNEPAKSIKYQNRKFLLFYQKKYYHVPPEHVVFDMGIPFPVPSGEAAHKLHECKSHQSWLEMGVHTRHFIKLKLQLRSTLLTGFYITFKIADTESSDIYIIRALHKTISKKFYDSWVAPHISKAEGGWSDEKREGKFKELILDEPSDDAQISPIAAGYDLATEPSCVFYARAKKPKADDATKGSLKKTIAKKAAAKGNKSVAPPEADDDDDDQSSACQSTALVPTQPAMSGMGMPGMGMAGGMAGGMNFFVQTPGMVTISESYLQQLIANQR